MTESNLQSYELNHHSSCGFYLEAQKHTGSWGSYFAGNSWERCDSNYFTRFGCTNTTYKSEDGNPEGDTVFVLTDCTTNERLSDGQDARYNAFEDGLDLRANLKLDLRTKYTGPLLVPYSGETCNRGCFCAYNRLQSVQSNVSAPYGTCDVIGYDSDIGTCRNILESTYRDFADSRDTLIPAVVHLTSANITLLKFYGIIECTAAEGPGSSGQLSPDLSWSWVPEVDDKVFMNPYDCFGDLNSIGAIMNNYTWSIPSLSYTNATSEPAQCSDRVKYVELNYAPFLPSQTFPGLTRTETPITEPTDRL